MAGAMKTGRHGECVVNIERGLAQGACPASWGVRCVRPNAGWLGQCVVCLMPPPRCRRHSAAVALNSPQRSLGPDRPCPSPHWRSAGAAVRAARRASATWWGAAAPTSFREPPPVAGAANMVTTRASSWSGVAVGPGASLSRARLLLLLLQPPSRFRRSLTAEEAGRGRSGGGRRRRSRCGALAR